MSGLRDIFISITERAIDAVAKRTNIQSAQEAQDEASVLELVNANPEEIARTRATAEIYLARATDSSPSHS